MNGTIRRPYRRLVTFPAAFLCLQLLAGVAAADHQGILEPDKLENNSLECVQVSPRGQGVFFLRNDCAYPVKLSPETCKPAICKDKWDDPIEPIEVVYGKAFLDADFGVYSNDELSDGESLDVTFSVSHNGEDAGTISLSATYETFAHDEGGRGCGTCADLLVPPTPGF